VETVLAGCEGLRLERELRRVPGADPGDGFYGAAIVRTAR
jgi:hypothetical protein